MGKRQSILLLCLSLLLTSLSGCGAGDSAAGDDAHYIPVLDVWVKPVLSMKQTGFYIIQTMPPEKMAFCAANPTASMSRIPHPIQSHTVKQHCQTVTCLSLFCPGTRCMS